ncbi:MAG TPA: hypothetical protein VIE66_02665 [Methylocella sp.]
MSSAIAAAQEFLNFRTGNASLRIGLSQSFVPLRGTKGRGEALIRAEVAAMSGFSDLLRMILDDPDAFDCKIRTQLDPNLVDQLTAYAASRNMPLPQTVLKALELFMLKAAEDAWRELSSGAELEGNVSAAPLSFILERFLTISLDPSRQGLIEGPAPPSILNQFRRMPEQ